MRRSAYSSMAQSRTAPDASDAESGASTDRSLLLEVIGFPNLEGARKAETARYLGPRNLILGVPHRYLHTVCYGGIGFAQSSTSRRTTGSCARS